MALSDEARDLKTAAIMVITGGEGVAESCCGMFRRKFLQTAGVLATARMTLGADPAGDGLGVRTHRGRRWTCYLHFPARRTLGLFLLGDDGTPLRNFPALERHLQKLGRRMVLGMNGGMFEADGSPVGWCVVDGITVKAPITNEGEGNFFLKPNGVFAVSGGKALVRETTSAARTLGEATLVTQSGPLLVIGGQIHRAFRENSLNRHIRNAIGVRADGGVWLAISEEPVSFHETATLFRDEFDCPDALFLDGVVSRLHAPRLGRNAGSAALGPLLAVTEGAS